MLEELKKKVYEANMLLPKHNLVTFTWGNVSGIDRDSGLFVIKPSGVEYDKLRPEDMVVVDLEGKKVEGELNPSSDTETHRVFYRNFKNIGGVVHTHSRWATIFAQAGQGVRAYGTTQGDYFYGDIPCTRELTQYEVEEDYEVNTGRVIIETIEKRNIDTMSVPGIVVMNHGPFAWGTSPSNAVYHAVVMEKVAEMDIKTLLLNPSASMQQFILDKHYYRKHGSNAYYGQNNFINKAIDW